MTKSPHPSADPLFAKADGRHDFDYRPVASRLLRHLARIAGDHDFMTGAGLHPDDLLDTSPPLFRQGYIYLLNHTRDYLQDDLFGFTSRATKPGTSAMMIEMALAQETLEAAIQQALRFLALVFHDLDLSLETHGTDVALTIRMTQPALDPEHFMEDHLLTYLHRAFSWMAGRLLPIKHLQLHTSDPVGPTRQCYQLRNNWVASSDRSALTIDRRFLALPIVRSQRDWQHFLRVAHAGEVEWPGDDIHYASQVRALILHALQQQQPLPMLERVASELHLTSQTLRRHLQREGHNFQQLLNSIRRDAAIHKLTVQHLSVGEVAAQLGFSEPRSFSRAFRQWTGYPPSTARMQPDATDNLPPPE